MPGTFPKLRTDAVAQYPATRVIRFQNRVLTFIDGTAQRYRESATALRQWEIRLDQLDEAEITALEQFFTDQQGAFGTFAFTDPWDDQVYPNCSFAAGDLGLTSFGEAQGRLALVVKENRE